MFVRDFSRAAIVVELVFVLYYFIQGVTWHKSSGGLTKVQKFCKPSKLVGKHCTLPLKYYMNYLNRKPE